MSSTMEIYEMLKVFWLQSKFIERGSSGNYGSIKSSIDIRSSRTSADKARQILCWKPKYGEEAFLEEIEEVVAAMVAEQA